MEKIKESKRKKRTGRRRFTRPLWIIGIIVFIGAVGFSGYKIGISTSTKRLNSQSNTKIQPPKVPEISLPDTSSDIQKILEKEGKLSPEELAQAKCPCGRCNLTLADCDCSVARKLKMGE